MYIAMFVNPQKAVEACQNSEAHVCSPTCFRDQVSEPEGTKLRARCEVSWTTQMLSIPFRKGFTPYKDL